LKKQRKIIAKFANHRGTVVFFQHLIEARQTQESGLFANRFMILCFFFAFCARDSFRTIISINLLLITIGCINIFDTNKVTSLSHIIYY